MFDQTVVLPHINKYAQSSQQLPTPKVLGHPLCLYPFTEDPQATKGSWVCGYHLLLSTPLQRASALGTDVG